jgi:hypothetical protein
MATQCSRVNDVDVDQIGQLRDIDLTLLSAIYCPPGHWNIQQQEDYCDQSTRYPKEPIHSAGHGRPFHFSFGWPRAVETTPLPTGHLDGGRSTASASK